MIMTAEAVTTVRLSTLGQTKLEGVALTRPKAVAFLTYLVLEGRQNRYYLADFFWQEAEDPMNSLRNQLFQLKPFAGHALKSTRQAVEVHGTCDALDFLQLIEQNQFEAAIALYQGEFLADFEAKPNSDLAIWLEITRNFMTRHVLEAHLQLAEQARQQKKLEQVKQQLEQAWNIAKTQNETLKKWYTQRQEDLEHRIAEQQKQIAPNNLVQLNQEFIGRNHEIKAILTSFQNQAHLITLFGFGGIGKTTLALETARTALRTQQYLDGIYSIALETAHSENDLLTRIVTTLEIILQTSQPMLEQIKTFIAQKSMLLILDNFEQLTDQTHIIAELLENSPNLRLLCTSREVLGLHAEHVYPISGLETNNISSGAVQLFVTRANKSYTESELQIILGIVRLLQGIPLAIELAVPQLKTHSLLELQAALQKSMDALQIHTTDLPERQRSIRAVFLHSWALLSQAERQGLKRMAIFKNGANRQALLEIAQMSLSQIANLIDKSFVQRAGQQRYTIHPLILEYTLELLQTDTEYEPILGKHATYYLDSIGSELPKIRGAEAASVMQKIETEFDNLKAAWAWALEKRDFDRIAALEEMVVYFDQKALFFQGIEFFENANDELKDAVNQPLMLSGIAIGIAWLHFRLGNAEEATFYGEYAVECAKSEPELGKNNLSKAYNILGNTASLEYEHTKALSYFNEAVRYCDSDNLKVRKVMILLAIAGIYREVEDFEGFWNTWESAYILNQELNLDNLKVLLTIHKANFLLYYVPNEEIVKFIPEMEEVYHLTRVTSAHTQPYFEILICQYCIAIKDLTKAEFWLQRFFLQDPALINPSLVLFSRVLLGKVEMLKGKWKIAEKILTQVLFNKFERQNVLAFFMTLVNLVKLSSGYENDFQHLIKLVITHKAMTNQELLVKCYLLETPSYLKSDFSKETSDQQIESARLHLVNKLRTAV
jgi:predicted ATPase